jgi:hypothetical protein
METARRSLEVLAHSWGQEIAEAPAEATITAGTTHNDDDKFIDPVSVATLVLSIPSVALAVQDLADRIHKRRRAKQLIDQAEQLSAQHVSVCLTFPSRTVELRTLAPDQLLDLLTDEDPTG